MNAANRSRSSLQIRDAVDFDTCPSPASSHNDSASRIDSPRTNAPITIAFNGSVRRNRFPRGNSLDTNGSAGFADLRDLDIHRPLRGLHAARAEPIALPRRGLRLALIPSAAQPAIELVLDRALDDQLRAKRRQLRQRALRILSSQPTGQQPVDPLLNLRRRRYVTSHGVRLLQSSCWT